MAPQTIDGFVRHGALFVPVVGEKPQWRDHRLQFEKWPLHELATRLPAFQRHDFPRSSWPAHATFADLPSHVALACSEALRHALLWSPHCASDVKLLLPKGRTPLPDIVANALWLRLEATSPDPQLLENHGVEAFMYPFTGSQWQFMRPYIFRCAQAIWMFDEAIESRGARDPSFKGNRLRETFTNCLGMGVTELVNCVQLIYAASAVGNPKMDSGSLFITPRDIETTAPWLSGSLTGSGLAGPLLAQALHILGASAGEMRARLSTGEGDANCYEAQLGGPGPLMETPVLFPFSDSRAKAVAPVPHLLFEFLHEPLTNRLYQAARAVKLTREFNLLFEEYVGLLLQRHSPSTWRWISEDELKTTKSRVVDWAAVFGSHVILVDAKRAWIDDSARHRVLADDWQSCNAALLDGVLQGAAFWTTVRTGRVRALHTAANKQPILILVTGSDNRVVPFPAAMRDQLAETAHKACPGLRIVVVGIDQLHGMMNTMKGRGPEWLLQTLIAATRRAGVVLDDQIEYRASGPLWNTFLETSAGRLASTTEAPDGGSVHV